MFYMYNSCYIYYLLNIENYFSMINQGSTVLLIMWTD